MQAVAGGFRGTREFKPHIVLDKALHRDNSWLLVHSAIPNVHIPYIRANWGFSQRHSEKSDE